MNGDCHERGSRAPPNPQIEVQSSLPWGGGGVLKVSQMNHKPGRSTCTLSPNEGIPSIGGGLRRGTSCPLSLIRRCMWGGGGEGIRAWMIDGQCPSLSAPGPPAPGLPATATANKTSRSTSTLRRRATGQCS